MFVLRNYVTDVKVNGCRHAHITHMCTSHTESNIQNKKIVLERVMALGL